MNYKIRKLGENIKSLSKYAKAIQENASKSLNNFSNTMSNILTQVHSFCQAKRKSSEMAQNAFKITYSGKDNSNSSGAEVQKMELEIVNLRQKILTLQNDHNSLKNENFELKNLNSLFLEQLKKEDHMNQAIFDNSESLSKTGKLNFSEKNNNNPSNSMSKYEKSASKGHFKTQEIDFSKFTPSLKNVNIKVDNLPNNKLNNQFQLDQKNNQNEKTEQKSEYYITKFKHEEILEEELVKVKQQYFKDIQKIKDEFVAKVNVEVSKELENELKLIEEQQLIFEQREIEIKKEEKNKEQKIRYLENELDELKECLANILEQQGFVDSNEVKQNNSSISVQKLRKLSEIDFKSPINSRKVQNWSESPFNQDQTESDSKKLIGDLKVKIANLEEQLTETLETISEDQRIFKEFNKIKSELENQVKVGRKKLEEEQIKTNEVKIANKNLEFEKSDLMLKIKTIAEKTETVIAKWKEKHVKTKQKLLLEMKETKRLQKLIEMLAGNSEFEPVNQIISSKEIAKNVKTTNKN